MNAFFLITLLIFSHLKSIQEAFIPNAFCNVPVADLIGAPIRTFFKIPSATTQELYAKIPYSEARGSYASPRIAQLLFNQAVEIIEIKNDEIKIKVPDMYYGNGTKLHNTYWTQAHYITPLTKRLIKGVPLSNNKTVTLTCPLIHPIQKITYSAGTSFVPTGKHKQGMVECFYYNPATPHQLKTLWITHDSIHTTKIPRKKIRKAFINLLKKLAHPKKGFVPYVFGGCSIGIPVNNNFYKEKVTFTPQPCIFFERPHAPTPRVGIDCARLFTRALRTLHINCTALNSKAFKMQLRPLRQHEKAQIGDFIYFSGHIAVISDVKKGLLIEARSYQDGYGKVHEISFAKQFQDIHTIQDLQQAVQTKKRVVRLNNSGKNSQFIDDLEILKFPY